MTYLGSAYVWDKLLIAVTQTTIIYNFITPCSCSNSSDLYLGKTAIPKGKVNREAYYVPGDINIGSILSITLPLDGVGCSYELYPGSYVIEYTEAVAYAVNLVNKDPHILPNITLGFVILDDCTDKSVALSQSLAFLPTLNTDSGMCRKKEDCYEESTPSNNDNHTFLPVLHYDVIGVLAPIYSIFANPISSMYASFHLPLVGYAAFSDDLSNKLLHPYFLRVNPPAKDEVRAMVKFLAHMNWTYVSMVYSEGSYGEPAFDTFKKYSKELGICLAVRRRVADNEDLSGLINELLKAKKARAVVLLAHNPIIKKVLEASRKKNTTGEFIWIISDSLLSTSKNFFVNLTRELNGGFCYTPLSKYDQNLYDYINNQSKKLDTIKNPWFKAVYRKLLGCSNVVTDVCSHDGHITDIPSFDGIEMASLVIDAVLAFAHAANNLITEKCPDARGEDVRKCVKGYLLIRYLRKVSFQGPTSLIKFNIDGDIQKGTYVSQIHSLISSQSSRNRPKFMQTPVARAGVEAGEIQFTKEKITWGHLKPRRSILFPGQMVSDIPESVCSRSCTSGEYRVVDGCCWYCQRCRKHEYLTGKRKNPCVPCEELTWPDTETNYTSCVAIPPTHTSITETLPMLLLILAILAIVLNLSICASLAYLHQHRTIKAASRELSFLQLLGIFIGYVNVMAYQFPPNDALCGTLYLTFCLSFTWLYAPMLVKAVRVYRIFQSSFKNERPRFVSPRSQLVLAMTLICIQFIICVSVYVIYRPRAMKYQRSPTEKHVEICCDMTAPGLASFLFYNLILVTLCSVFAFKTRTLPEDFNESRFSSMCVSTTLVIWSAFIPTYFTAERTLVRVMLLSVAMLLNHTVALVFLFVPKIYGVFSILDNNNQPMLSGNTIPIATFAEADSGVEIQMPSTGTSIITQEILSSTRTHSSESTEV